MAFSSATKVPRMPVVVILGSTGTGKTKLSLEIAQKFAGEILSADSMQVYTGLDIITAKATKEERSLAPHHLLDVVDPLKAFTVVDFRNRAVSIIDELLARNKMPIVVGGTNYYIESLLWKVLVDNPGSMPGDAILADCEPDNKRPRLDDDLSSVELHKQLQELDPDMARRLHPNNRRKIMRSLEVLKQRGRRHSDILREQQTSEGGSSLGGPLRYPNSLIFWLRCDQNVLDDRLNDRVDDMMKQGLVQELTNFHTRYNRQRLQDNALPDYTKGIFQSIGFKEFHEYLILSEEEREKENGKKLLQTGVKNLKMVTRRYARKQIKWVANRFLGRPERQAPLVYGLDTTEVSKWNENVKIPAFDLIESYLADKESCYKPLPVKSLSEATTPFLEEETYNCEICDRVFIGDLQWNAHRISKKHNRMVKRKQRESNKRETVQKKNEEERESAEQKNKAEKQNDQTEKPKYETRSKVSE